MAEQSTYIKIDRNIVNWRWFKSALVYQLFSWLIIKANVKDHEFQKTLIKRGCIATSYESMADACGMSLSSVRRIIKNLEETGEIERTIKDHYQIIKIVKYDEYQGCSLRTSNRQPVEQPVEHPLEQPVEHQYKNNKNIKNGKNGKKKNIKKTSPTPLDGVGDVPKAKLLKPVEEGTVDDIPEEFRDICETYADYVRLRNR